MVKPVILVFIDWYKPAYKAGGPITSCVNLIEALKNHFHFKVYTSCFDYLEKTPLQNIKIDTWRTLDGVDVFYASQKMQTLKFISQCIQYTPHEILWINGIFSPRFSILPLIYRNKKKPCIVSARGMLGSNVLQFKSKKKGAFLKVAQWMNWYKGIIFHATNESEKNDIQQIFTTNKIVVVPNVPTQPKAQITSIIKEKGELKLLMVARIAYEKNTLFALQVLQEVKGKVQLDIVGSVYDTDYFEKCKEAVLKLKPNVKVRFINSKLPAEIENLYQDYHAFYLPTLGENFGHAIAESLSYGLPIIISDKTMWRDLKSNKAGFDLPLDEGVFKESLEHFVQMSNQEFEQWRTGAKNYYQKKVNWSAIVEQNKKLFDFEQC